MAAAVTLGRIEEFNKEQDDWPEYKERLDQYFKANGLDTEEQAERRVAVFLTVIEGSTYKLLPSLLTPELPATKTYEELTKMLADHLAPKPLAIAERFKLRQRNQKQGESVARYLAEHCEFGAKLEEHLRDQFVAGTARCSYAEKVADSQN